MSSVSYLYDSLWFGRDEPAVDADGEVLEEAVMLADLGLEAGVGDAGLEAGGRVLVQRPSQLLHALLVEAHPVLVHAGAHDVLQLGLLDEPIPCNTQLGVKLTINAVVPYKL